MKTDKDEIIRNIKVIISFIIAIPLGILLLFSLDYSPSGTISNMIANIFAIIEWFN